MTRDQERIWEQEKRAVRCLQDGLGRPVDRPVLEVVAMLRLLGFETYGSCGGHPERVLSPYIAFRSPRCADYRQRLAGVVDAAQQRQLRRVTLESNAHELERLLGYLERFYSQRDVPYAQRLIVQGFGLIGYRLTSQAADLIAVLPLEQRRKLVTVQRTELHAFSEFMKSEFFGVKAGDSPAKAKDTGESPRT